MCKNIKSILKIAFIVTTFSIMIPASGFSVTASEITRGMACTCGCNMVVAACEGSMECSAAAQITREVEQMVEEGRTKKEILQNFVNRYGETILAAPTKEGFNFLAWVLPFMALALGVGGIYLFIDRALRSGIEIDESAEPRENIPEADKKYYDQINRELDAFEI